VIVVLDNYDSFTFNLVQYLLELGADLKVIRNDELSVDELCALEPQGVMISPGPSSPQNAGISVSLIQRARSTRLPILGVCLGHQSIAEAFGGEVCRARVVMHGKLSPIHHLAEGVFRGLPTPFQATRYHSLIVSRDKLPDELVMTAWTEFSSPSEAGEDKRPPDPSGAPAAFAKTSFDEIMGIRHRELPIEGVQFHPESILSEHGHALLQNWLQSLA